MEDLINGNQTEDFKYPAFRAALTSFLFAACLLGFNFALIYGEGKYYPKLFAFGFVCLGFVVGFLVAPGERIMKIPAGSTMKDKSNFSFKCGNGIDTAIHFSFAGLCLIAAIFVIIKEDFYLCLPCCLAVVLLGAVILFVKVIVEWIKDSGKSLEEKEEMANDYTKYNSVLYRILSIVLSALIGFICAFSLYERLPLFASDFGLKGFENVQRIHHEKWADKLIKENLDKEVPFRIVGSADERSIDILINTYEIFGETDEEQHKYLTITKAPLSKLISYVMADEKRILSFSEDKGYSEYNKASLEKNASIKKYFEQNPDALETGFFEFDNICSCLHQLNTAENGVVDIVVSEEAESLLNFMDGWCIVSDPYWDSEFICLWDIPSFTEYYNKTYNTSYTEEELLIAFNEKKFTDYDIVCTDVGPALYYYYRQRKYTCGLIINFGTESYDCYSSLAMDKIMSKLCQNEEYIKYVKNYLEIEDEDIEKM